MIPARQPVLGWYTTLKKSIPPRGVYGNIWSIFDFAIFGQSRYSKYLPKRAEET
jgi:hypothetical protein